MEQNQPSSDLAEQKHVHQCNDFNRSGAHKRIQIPCPRAEAIFVFLFLFCVMPQLGSGSFWSSRFQGQGPDAAILDRVVETKNSETPVKCAD